MAERPLTEKQQRFCDEYIVDFNATQAYIRAGYSVRNEGNAAAAASVLLRNHKIASELEARMLERQQRTEITQDMVVRELARIAFGDLRSAMSWTGRGISLKHSSELTDDEAAALAEISEGKDGVKVKRYDKIKALELLGKHLGMFREVPQETAATSLADAIQAAHKEDKP